MNKKYYYTKEELKKAVENSKSIAGVCRCLNIATAGSNYARVKKAIEEYGLDTSHFTGQLWNKGLHCRAHYKQPLEALLVKNGTSSNNSILKKRLFNEGFKEYVCEGCGLTEWQGKPINLELHHINGHPTDNRLENLQMLCPNCHSYTDNYCSKNKKKKEIVVDREDDIITELNVSFESSETPVKENPAVVKPKKPRKQKQVRTCPCCGKEFTGKRAVYCSEECYLKCKKSGRPGVIELLRAFKKFKSYLAVGKHFGVTDQAVRKWVILYRIEDILNNSFKNRDEYKEKPV